MLSAARRTARTDIRSWQLPSATGIADTVGVDTMLLNMALRDRIYDYSINCAYNANFVSPVQTRIYFDRRQSVDDIFASQYEPYLITAQKQQFYRTNLPYSKVGYNHGFTTGHEEHEINFLFTGNITRRFNAGFQIDYLKGYGHYANQEAMNLRGSLFWTYNSPHYNQQAVLTWTNVNNFENGGIRDLADLTSQLKPEDYPTRMQGMSEYKYLAGYLNHYYTITKERQVNDTTTIDVPLMTFRHIFETNQSSRRYAEKNPTQTVDSVPYYEHTYFSRANTNDQTRILTVRNTLSVTFEEEFNKALRFGAQAFAYIENQRFLMQRPCVDSTATLDSLSRYNHWTHNLFVGGTIYKRNGKYFHYGAEGEVCLVGYKIGQFEVKGHIDADFPLDANNNIMYVRANAYVGNKVATYYDNHYFTNHHRRDTTFARTFRYGVGGEIEIPYKYVQTKLGVNFEDMQNPLYYEQGGILRQHDGHIQVISGRADVNFRSPWICLDNSVVLQFSSSDHLPLPLLSLYHNLYYHGWWVKGAMEAQIGVDCRYWTAYHSPVLDPATGQFCVQTGDQRQRIGNYPVLDLYASAYVKHIHLKFFVAWTHFNNLFMSKNTHRLLMPSYPMNDWTIRAGASFHFYR